MSYEYVFLVLTVNTNFIISEVYVLKTECDDCAKLSVCFNELITTDISFSEKFISPDFDFENAKAALENKIIQIQQNDPHNVNDPNYEDDYYDDDDDENDRTKRKINYDAKAS